MPKKIVRPDTPLTPQWMPENEESELRPAGRWWDAVRMPAPTGERVVRLLSRARQPAGPVIADPQGVEARMFFLVPTGTADRWSEPGTVAFGATCHVIVPPPSRTRPPGVHWYRLPTGPRVLAHPNVLRRALATARGEQERADDG